MNAPGRQTARIDAVEIKITVAAEDLERAIEIFGLDPAEGKNQRHPSSALCRARPR